MAITTYPASCVSPYAPVILVQDTGTFTLTATRAAVFQPVTLQREVKDGKATFDLSAILKTTYRDVQTKITVIAAPELDLMNDGLLNSVGFKIDATHTLMAMRCVIPRGKVNDLTQITEYPNIMLEAFRHGRDVIDFPKYDGFPIEIGLFSFNEDSQFKAVTDAGAEYGFDTIFTFTSTLNCSAISSLVDVTGNKKVTFYEGCTPDDPVYVRWINTIGAWEYFMFSGSRGLGQRVERGDTFALAGAYDIGAKETTGELPPTVTDYITCGAEQLERPEFEALKTIATSPYVQIYDTARKAFTRCLVNGTDIVWNTQAARGQIDLELTLMTPYTQF